MKVLHCVYGIIVVLATSSVNQVTGGSVSPTKAAPPEPKDKSSSAAAAIGGAVGACIAVVIVVIVVAYCVRFRRGTQNQPGTKPDVNITYGNPGNNAIQKAAVSDDKTEPYTNLSMNRAVHVYHDLGVGRNVGKTSIRDETEYNYISKSDMIVVQRQARNQIPSVRNQLSNDTGLQNNSVTSSIKMESSDGPSKEKQLKDKLYLSLLRGEKSNDDQIGNQQMSSATDSEITQPHEYIVMKPELTGL